MALDHEHRVDLFPKLQEGAALDIVGLSLVTGWLPSQIEQEDYAMMMGVIERLQAQQKAAQQQADEQKLAAEKMRWKRQHGYR